MTTRSIHSSIMFLALASACAADGESAAFRGDEHESTGTDTGGETGKTDGEDTHKDVGDTGAETGGDGPCPRTQGYWKNHSVYAGPDQNQIAWPISEDTLACENTWYEWLHTPPQGGDAWVILAHQYIAASLNEAAGAEVPADVQDTLAAAGDLLENCSIADEERDEAIAASEMLDAYNNGAFTDSCGEGGDDGDDGDDDDDCDCDDDDDNDKHDDDDGKHDDDDGKHDDDGEHDDDGKDCDKEDDDG